MEVEEEKYETQEPEESAQPKNKEKKTKKPKSGDTPASAGSKRTRTSVLRTGRLTAANTKHLAGGGVKTHGYECSKIFYEAQLRCPLDDPHQHFRNACVGLVENT